MRIMCLVSTKKPCATCFGTKADCVDCSGNGFVERRVKRSTQVSETRDWYMAEGKKEENQDDSVEFLTEEELNELEKGASERYSGVEWADVTIRRLITDIRNRISKEQRNRVKRQAPDPDNESVKETDEIEARLKREFLEAKKEKSTETRQEWEIARDEVLKIYPKSTAEFNPCGEGSWAIASHSMEAQYPMMLSEGWLSTDKKAWLSAWEVVQVMNQYQKVDIDDEFDPEKTVVTIEDQHNFNKILNQGRSTPGVKVKILNERQGPESLRTMQFGGDHYKKMKIEPATIIHENSLDWFQGTALKYIMRHKLKGGAEDMKKAMHYCRMILELQYGIQCQITFEEKVKAE